MSAIADFWDEQARLHGANPQATAPDVAYRDLEVRAVLSVMRQPRLVLDVGCGNGWSTNRIADAHPEAQFTAVDTSDEMLAHTPNSPNVVYTSGDALRWLPSGPFDHVYTIRCLINLTSEEEQFSAINNLIDRLEVGGRLILVENTVDGLMRLNHARGLFGLEPIAVRWHNLYFNDERLREFLGLRLDLVDVCNIGSPYYLVSRVVYAALCKERREEPKYDHPINRFAAQLPVMGDCSPNMIYVGVKR